MKSIEDWDVPDLGEGGGDALEMSIPTVPVCSFAGRIAPTWATLVHDVDVLLRVVALMLVPEDAHFEVEHHIAHLTVSFFLIHLYDAVDGRVREVLVFDDELVIMNLQA